MNMPRHATAWHPDPRRQLVYSPYAYKKTRPTNSDVITGGALRIIHGLLGVLASFKPSATAAVGLRLLGLASGGAVRVLPVWASCALCIIFRFLFVDAGCKALPGTA